MIGFIETWRALAALDELYIAVIMLSVAVVLEFWFKERRGDTSFC